MVIIEDTRQQAGKHELKHKYFKEHGIKVVRSKLPVGDYARIDNMSVVIDTKQDLLEVHQNLTKGHERFRNECLLAQESGIKLIVLIESEIKELDGMITVKKERYKKTINGTRLSKTMKTMTDRYGVEFIICDPEEAPEEIIKILEKL